MNSKKPILILGGYGGVGRHLSHLLLQETETRVIVAGRNQQKANDAVNALNNQFPDNRASALGVDASNAQCLRAVYPTVQMVVACTPTMEHTELIAREALQAGIDYMDLHVLGRIVPMLRALHPEKQGCCFITQGGFHPGLLAPLVNRAAPWFTTYRKADIGMVMNFLFPESTVSTPELIQMVGDYQGQILTAGAWRKAGWRDAKQFDFGPEFGVRTCIPLDFEELHSVARLHQLQQTGCFAAGFNWFVDGLLFPVCILVAKLRRGLGTWWLGRWLVWGVKHFSHPPYGVVLQLQAEGEKDGQPQALQVSLYHPDPYEFTAIAVVACLKQYLDGSIANPGLWLMGEVVDTDTLFQDLQSMGVHIETREASANPHHAAHAL